MDQQAAYIVSSPKELDSALQPKSPTTVYSSWHLLHKERQLILSGNWITGENLQRLRLLDLKLLILQTTKLSQSDVNELKALTQLHGLYLCDVRVSQHGLRELLTNAKFRIFAAHRMKVTAAALVKLGTCSLLTNFMIADANVGDEGAAYITKHHQLKAIQLSSANLTDTSCVQFLMTPKLEDLDVSKNNITDEGCSNLGKLHSLRRLDLSSNPISDEGVAALLELQHLRRLRLRNCNVTDGSLSTIARLAQIELLLVDGTRLTRSGILQLRDLRDLRTLTVCNSTIPPFELQKLVPNVQVAVSND